MDEKQSIFLDQLMVLKSLDFCDEVIQKALADKRINKDAAQWLHNISRQEFDRRSARNHQSARKLVESAFSDSPQRATDAQPETALMQLITSDI